MRRQNISRTIFQFFKEEKKEPVVGVCYRLQMVNIRDEVKMVKLGGEVFSYLRADLVC